MDHGAVGTETFTNHDPIAITRQSIDDKLNAHVEVARDPLVDKLARIIPNGKIVATSFDLQNIRSQCVRCPKSISENLDAIAARLDGQLLPQRNIARQI